MFKVVGFVAALHWTGFSCSTDSGTFDAPASSLYDCEDDGDCTEEGEICYTDYDCTETDDDSCIDETGDYQCHRDCSDDEDCASGEPCTYVGDKRWMCIGS